MSDQLPLDENVVLLNPDPDDLVVTIRFRDGKLVSRTENKAFQRVINGHMDEFLDILKDLKANY